MSSVASCADVQDNRLYKKPSIHRRNNSGELDVFEASNYFSSASNVTINDHHQSVSSHKPNLTTKSYKEHLSDQAGRPKGRRMSLDTIRRPSKMKVPELKNVHKVHDHKMKQNQPSSPGGRLAGFLNALFNHSASKKKNSKQDDPIIPRMRRSSISDVDTRSLYLTANKTSATGFRTPPPVYKTFFDDSKSLQDHKCTTNRSKSLIGLLDERLKISNGSLSSSGFDKSVRDSANGVSEKDKVCGDGKIGFKKIENQKVKHFELKKQIKDDEDGDDQSDTSSDLFELPNCDFGEFQSGLPVYETTNVDQIKNSENSNVAPDPHPSQKS